MTDEGVYKAQALSWGLGKASTGTPQFVLRVKVIEEAIDEGDPKLGFRELVNEKTGEVQPLVREIFLYFSPKTKDRSLAELRSIGYKYDVAQSKYLVPGGKDSFDFGSLPPFLVRCEHDEFKGRQKERWQVAKQMRAELTREDLDQFDNMMSDGVEEEASSPASR